MNIADSSESGVNFNSKNFAIYILGAGFSQPAGLPLAQELWKEILRRGLKMSGRAELFRQDLDYYLEYRKRCDGVELSVEQINFEDFIGFLDIEYHLWLRGGDTWSVHGNEAQVVVKTLIGEILSASMPREDNIPDLYLQFAKLLKPRDIVLTFNYDILLERALTEAGVQFRLFPDRYRDDPDKPGGLIIEDREEVVIMKLHGSIDWFDRSQYTQLEEDRQRNGFPPGGPDLIFQNPEEYGAVPLIEGPHYPADRLHQIYRIKDIERLYRRGVLFHVTPSLLNPSSMKIIYSEMFRDFWSGMGKVGVLNFKMAIIGFSLPKEDEYARQVIYRLVTNYQATYWGEDVLSHKKRPLVIVDFRNSMEEQGNLMQRYAFVDLARAQLYFGGFNAEAIEMLRK